MFFNFFINYIFLFFASCSSILDHIGIAGLAFRETLRVTCSMWRSAVEGMDRILQSVSLSEGEGRQTHLKLLQDTLFVLLMLM